MIKNQIDVITLGCSKNLVDSEKLMKLLEESGYTLSHNPTKVNGEIVVINTCGFIGDALESGAYLSRLCRERIGEFSRADAIDIENVREYLTNN